LFENYNIESCSRQAELHIEKIFRWIRPKALDRISWHKNQGHRLILVSASLDVYLNPLYAQLGFHDLLCTRLDKQDGKFTGALIGRNCRGPEKVRLLTELLGPLGLFEIYAYGDSAGDKELLAVANHARFRPF
jgi:HAD superfamily hydrolase (TIGR01490 family)